MKTAHLKKRFYAFGKSLNPPFIKDETTKGNPAYRFIKQISAPMKRSAVPGQWQYLDLQFNGDERIIYLNLGLSPDDDYALRFNHSFFEPESYQPGQSVFFRAKGLWTRLPSADGFLIRPKELHLNDLYELAGTTDRKELLAFVAGRNFSDGQGGLNTGFRWMERINNPPELFFKTDLEALEGIEQHIMKYVLPYFDRMAQRQLEYKAGQDKSNENGAS